MYYAPKEHNPPHIHVYYGDLSATVRIEDCIIAEGKLPARQLRLVAAWIELHWQELMETGHCARTGKNLIQLNL
jgi:hypothetical protein